jgi:hypothetical protein
MTRTDQKTAKRFRWQYNGMNGNQEFGLNSQAVAEAKTGISCYATGQMTISHFEHLS